MFDETLNTIMKTILLLTLSVLFSANSFTQINQVADFNPGPGGTEASPVATINGNLIISTWNVGFTETRIWSTDGINAPTQLTQINPSLIPGKYVEVLGEFNGKLYFTYANPSGGFGEGLWEYDFTNTPTKIVDSELATEELNNSIVVFNSKMYFGCSDPTNGMELWSYDGINPPSFAYGLNTGGHSYPNAFTLFQSKLYFAAFDGTTQNLYEFDGVSSPTIITNNVYYYTEKPFPIINNKFYFTKRTNIATFSECVYEFDGTNVTLLSMPNVGEGLAFRSTNINSAHFGVLYFNVTEWATGQWKYWEYDFINPAGPSTYNLHSAASLNNEAYFVQNLDAQGAELWKYDGTTATRLSDLNPAGDTYFSTNPYSFGNKIYFGASDEITGTELWVYDPNFSDLSENTSNPIQLYPNPASDLLTIDTKEAIELVEIYSELGQLVQTETQPNFSIETLHSGVYFVHITTHEGTVISRFVKQ